MAGLRSDQDGAERLFLRDVFNTCFEGKALTGAQVLCVVTLDNAET